MSLLFELSVTFNPSKDFTRCVVLAHIGAVSLLLLSNAHPLLIALGLIVLFLSQCNARQASPQPHYQQLSCFQHFWRLDFKDGRQEKYDSVHIQFDGGFFMLLLLIAEDSKKRLVLFNDQITQHQHRQLSILSRIILRAGTK